MQIPLGAEGSAALQLVVSQGWKFKPGTSPNIELETCPICKKSGYGHLYMEVHGPDDPKKQRDGLWICQHCGKSGNLYALRTHLGLAHPSIQGTKEYGYQTIESLPDIDACHEALMADADALDYLIDVRGFSKDIITRQKLGLIPDRPFRGLGPLRALVIPYMMNDNCVFVHFRTLPDPDDLAKIPKAVNCPKGWDAALYNGGILKEGLKELILVEGEMDAIAALDKGIENVCGIPGANVKKAEWLETLDKLSLSGLERIYICYDIDKAGQKGAQALASRIGIEKCWKLKLPPFMIVGADGVLKQGKDLNEWFHWGDGTVEEFEQLKLNAELFDVDGVASAGNALEELGEEFEGKGSAQKYTTPWPTLSNVLRFDEGDVIDILAPEKIGKTTFGLNIMEFMVDKYHEDGVIICLEMTRARMARKWLAHKAGIADVLPKTEEDANQLTALFKNAIPGVKQYAADREGQLYFCYPRYKDAEDIYKIIIDCIRRYGVKWIMLDNVQLLCDGTKGNRNRTEYLSEISKALAKITKDYGVQMLRILQPHRIANGSIASSDSVDGSSQIAKDCDCMIVLNRIRIDEVSKDTLSQGGYIQSEGTFSPDLLTQVCLSRYSAGGSTTLYINGATSTVSEQAEGKIAEMNAKIAKATASGWQNTMVSMGTFATNAPTTATQGEITL